MHARLRGSKSLLNLYQIIKKPDFPSLADIIAEPHPDMSIKVAAFTVSEKSSNTQIEDKALPNSMDAFPTTALVPQPLILEQPQPIRFS